MPAASGPWTPDFHLKPGVLETRSFGNKFNGKTDADGKVTAGFTASGDEDMVLRLTGYDVDSADEIEIFVNGVSIGFLEAGVNEGTKVYVLTIPSDLLVSGENSVTFSQTGPVSWKWGVTNLVIEEAGPVAHLEAGVAETGTWGNTWNGRSDADGIVSMTFDATAAEDLTLTFDGYDIDSGTEVEILLNGVSLGFLAAGVNDDLRSYEYTLSSGDLIAGENTLTFRQATDVTFKWGVTNVLVGQPGPDLVTGVADTRSFGNNFNGATSTSGVVELTFEATAGTDMVLSVDGYDIDTADEIEVLLNGVSLGFLGAGTDGGLASYQLGLYGFDLQDGLNTLAFRQAQSPTWTWGVTNILVEEATGPLPPAASANILTPGTTDFGFFGNNFNGATDADGRVDFLFEATGGDLWLNFSGYDIDTGDEVEVFLNNVSLGRIAAGSDLGLEDYAVQLPGGLLLQGTNKISFVQVGSPTWTWGVTNVAVDTQPRTDAGPVILTPGIVDTGSYGQNFAGQVEADGSVTMEFEGTGERMRLSFEAYDVDSAGEVTVYLNGIAISALAAGENNGLASYAVDIAADDMLAGTNVIEFRQTVSATNAWGVTNVLLEPVTLPHLALGVTDGASYGNNINGVSEPDGAVEFTFDRTGSDLALSLEGYDIDWADEVEIFLNGVSIGFLGAGVHLGYMGYDILLPDAGLQDGQNTISFVQARDATFTWGVTNLTLKTAVIDPGPTALALGVADTGTYGNRYDGNYEPDGVVAFTFTSDGTDLTLSFDGYDIDSAAEVEVFLNGQSLGFLGAGVNNGLKGYEIDLAGTAMAIGENTISFVQAQDAGFIWGVTNILLEEVVPPALTLGVTDTGSYGNNFNGASDADGIVSFTFQNTGTDLVLDLYGYDIDWADEVEVVLNGSSIGFLDAGVNNGQSFAELLLSQSDLLAGENTISFVQARDAGFTWGVTKLTLREAKIDQGPVALDIGVTDTGTYGNRHDGAYDTDGVQAATFEGIGQDLELRLSAYDVDTATEIEVVLNGVSLGTLEPGVNNGYAYYRILLPADAQVAGTNMLEFRQADNVTFTWGIADLRLDIAPETYTPTDTLYSDQWYLGALGQIERVWADYTGAGVTVGVYDNGVEYTHHDLDGNYDTALHATSGGATLDPALGTAEHGTAVAGIIAAENDGTGIVGIAFDATISGVDIIGGPASAGSADLTAYIDAMEHLTTFDVVNNSWGSVPGFDQSAATLTLFSTTVALFNEAVATGRGGLGTVLVKSAGNASANSAGDMIDSSRTTITVGAVNDQGNAASYSNHGANLLVSAPSSDPFLSALGIMTTDLTGSSGYTAGDYTGTDGATGFGGTSAAAPMVSGVVALMLEANPGLGWRDVKTILSYSANHTGRDVGAPDPLYVLLGISSGYDWQFNGADNWNGGGLHFSEDYGYGVIDVFAAVRMAEAWHLFGEAQTSVNELSHSAVSTGPVTVQAGGYQTVSFTGADILVDTVEITLSMTDAATEVYLVSAEGTRVQLLGDVDAAGALSGWTFGAEAFRGENGSGIWTLEFAGTGAGSSVTDWAVTIYGGQDGPDDVYHYTDEIFAGIVDDGSGNISSLADDPSRTTLSDTSGEDWLDLSAMTGNLAVSLESGATSTSDRMAFLTIAADTVIENLVAGDGNDVLTGNDADNEIHGMRGSDRLAGGAGADLLFGGAGADTFVFAFGDGADTVGDFDPGVDVIELWGFGTLDFASLGIASDADENAMVDFGGGDVLVFAGVSADQLGADDFRFYELDVA